MTNIAIILNEATDKSFVLLDELGSGTDPIEGSSLAISILEYLNNLNTITLSTTHYSELKHYALITDGFENASVEFNIENLSPTYKLLLGVPGTSNAFEISRKLGISEKIISRAKSFIDTDSINIEKLLNNIYEDKKTIETEKQKIIDNSTKIQKLRENLETSSTTLEERKKEIINNAKIEARNILLSAKEEVNEIIQKIENNKNIKEANALRNKLNKKINDLQSNDIIINSNKELSINDLKLNMDVFVPKINQIGKILSITKDNKIQIEFPLGKMFFNIKDIELTNKTNSSKTVQNYKKHEFKVKSISPEINVIGQNIEEACFSIDKYLDTCIMNGLNNIRIVHGKGTGALRNGIHSFLKTHPHVKSFRIGTFGEGEMGVTIVELK